jgi:hypothetical protein
MNSNRSGRGGASSKRPVRAHPGLRAGDYRVAPANPHHRTLAPVDAARLDPVRIIAVPAPPVTWLRTMTGDPWGGRYAFGLSSQIGPPWRLTSKPLEYFTIERVRGAEATKTSKAQ